MKPHRRRISRCQAEQLAGNFFRIVWTQSGETHCTEATIWDVKYIPYIGVCLLTDIRDIPLNSVLRLEPLPCGPHPPPETFLG